MADFKLKSGEQVRTRKMTKASATVIEAGDFVGLTSGLIVKGTAAHTKLGWCEAGAASGATTADVTVGNDFTLQGAGDAVFAVTQKGTDVDLVVNATVQQVDVGTSSTLVLTIQSGTDSGVVGSAADIEVRIKKPLDV